MKRTILCFSLLLLAACAHQPQQDTMKRCTSLTLSEPVEIQWLQQRYTVEEVERETLVNGKPFGYINDQWLDLKAQMQPGDEIWKYTKKTEPPPKLPPGALALDGEGGFALVRGCTVVKRIVVWMA